MWTTRRVLADRRWVRRRPGRRAARSLVRRAARDPLAPLSRPLTSLSSLQRVRSWIFPWRAGLALGYTPGGSQ